MKEATIVLRDPVCGMEIDPASAADQSMYPWRKLLLLLGL
jgi:hypothetical protein